MDADDHVLYTLTEDLTEAIDNTKKWTHSLRLTPHALQFLHESRMLYSLFWKAQAGVTKRTLETEFIPM